MENIVFVKSYETPPIDTKEILRYAGVRSDTPELDGLLSECLDEIRDRLSYKVCYRELPISCIGEQLDLDFCRTDSRSLRKNLNGCDRIILFAATVGIEIDRLTARYASLSPTKALLFQAIGNERIESLCDAFNSEIAEQMRECGRFVRPRFSPGYQDLPLEMQRDVFAVLDCPRKIGLTLNESLLMSPAKSVTAMIGVGTP